MPHPGFVPFAQTPPARHAAAEFLGQHLPRDATLGSDGYPSEDARQSRSIWKTRASAFGLGRFGRQQRLDHCPERIRDEEVGRLPKLHPDFVRDSYNHLIRTSHSGVFHSKFCKNDKPSNISIRITQIRQRVRAVDKIIYITTNSCFIYRHRQLKISPSFAQH